MPRSRKVLATSGDPAAIVRRILAELQPQNDANSDPVPAEEHRVHAEALSVAARGRTPEQALAELVAWAEDRELPNLQARFREFDQKPLVRCVADYFWWPEVIGG